MLSVSPLLAVTLCVGLASAGCPDGWSGPVFDFCYYSSDYSDKRDPAAHACTLLGSGSQIVSIHSATENSFIVDSFGNGDYWIGFNDIQTEGLYKWDDGTPWNFTYWASHEPNDAFGEDCGIISEGKWNDKDCGDENPFICKMAATA